MRFPFLVPPCARVFPSTPGVCPKPHSSRGGSDANEMKTRMGEKCEKASGWQKMPQLSLSLTKGKDS